MARWHVGTLQAKKCESAKVRIWQGFLIPVFSPSKAIFTKTSM